MARGKVPGLRLLPTCHAAPRLTGLRLEAEHEQGVLARIRELKAAGHSTREIADELNRLGYTTRRGSAWRFQYGAEALRAS